MIKFIKKELEIEESLKERIIIICDFCNTKPTITNDKKIKDIKNQCIKAIILIILNCNMRKH